MGGLFECSRLKGALLKYRPLMATDIAGGMNLKPFLMLG
jgi:hypothetical protein